MIDPVKVKIVLDPGAKTPVYASKGAAACDVHAYEGVVLEPGHRALVSTGIYMQIPDGYECQVRPRSGLAFINGLTVLNTPGTIDSDYRGEIKVLMYNTGTNNVEIEEGDRIAQLVFAPVTKAYFDVVNELSNTERSTGGFGSTGR